MKLKGILKSAFGSYTTEGTTTEDGEIGMTADGEIFAIMAALNAAGAPVAIPEIDVVVITTTNTGTDINSAADTEVLATNTSRKSVDFFNQSATDSIFLAFEGVAATLLFFELLPQAYYSPGIVTQGAVNAISAAGTPTLLINEGE